MLDHFDIVASIYDRVIGIQDQTRLKQLLKLPIDGWLLDAAGGTGRGSFQLAPLVGKLVVCDLSHKMLREAKRKPGLVPIRSTIERLPFADESFDRMLLVDSFHHLRDQKTAIGEMLRVLKPGGRLIIEEPDIHHFGVKLVAIAEKIFFMRSHFFSAEQIKAMFSSHKISISIENDDRYTSWIIVDKN